MMNFIMLMVAIYVALVGASLTIMVVGVSNWYANKCKKLTHKFMDDFDNEL